MAERDLSERRISMTELVIQAALLAWLFVRLIVFTVLLLAVFVAVFLGYFTLPFLILGAFLLLFGIRSAAAALAQLRVRIVR